MITIPPDRKASQSIEITFDKLEKLNPFLIYFICFDLDIKIINYDVNECILLLKEYVNKHNPNPNMSVFNDQIIIYIIKDEDINIFKYLCDCIEKV